MIYRVGQIWERDGKRREIVAIKTGAIDPYHGSTDGLTGYEILWQRGLGEAGGWCWGGTWRNWAKGAKIVGVRK